MVDEWLDEWVGVWSGGWLAGWVDRWIGGWVWVCCPRVCRFTYTLLTIKAPS